MSIMSIGTSSNQVRERIKIIMRGTSNHTKEDKSGSEMEPWVIAILKIVQKGDEQIDVEHATDAEFDAWIKQHGSIKIEDGDVGSLWCFEDRCDVINHIISHGLKLKILTSNNSFGELFEASQTACRVRLEGE